MDLNILRRETFDQLLNSGLLKVVENGPLAGPIDRFEVCRDQRKELILTTHSSSINHRDFSQSINAPAGSIHSLDGSITFAGMEFTVLGSGIHTFHVQEKGATGHGVERIEKSSINILESMPPNTDEVHQLIEWVENLDTFWYMWPDHYQEVEQTTLTRKLGADDDPIVQTIEGKTVSLRGCLKLLIDGIEVCIAPDKANDTSRPSGPGFILYKGFPTEITRKKIRECLSFLLGLPILYLGYTLLSKSFNFLGFKAITPHVISEEIYRYPARPPFPTGRISDHPRSIDPDLLSRSATAIYKQYDALNFRHLNWIYWHAIFSPTHTQPVQFGAGIEALQAIYRASNKGHYNTALIAPSKAKILQQEFLKIVDTLNLPDAEKAVLQKKASTLNNPSQDLLNSRFFNALDLDLAAPEIAAWKRRNDSAHGNPNEEGSHSARIKDNDLLKNLFHRILAKMTGASHTYVDYFTVKHPIRNIRHSIEDTPYSFYSA